jgi:tetratricopeptide (TPR) repeat protein
MDGRSDRSTARGLKVASRGDLIEDIHRQQRRRVLKRAAQFTALAIALLAAGFGFKVMADRHERSHALESARSQFVGGTIADLQSAVSVLSQSLERRPDDIETEEVLALARAHLWLEFGYDEEAARAAVDAVPSEDTAGALSHAIIVFGDGDIDAAAKALESIDSAPTDPFLLQERAWLGALVAVAQSADDPSTLESAQTEVDAALEQIPDAVALHRVSARLQLAMGNDEEALGRLEHARGLSASHVGLAADEALYNAYLHRELAGVASVADQLLARDDGSLAPRDRAHAQLARAVAHVRQGESEAGLALLDEAFEGLAPWNHQARRLALMTAAEAADAERVRDWLGEAGLSEHDQEVFGAWATFLQGDVMKALEQLSDMPQEEAWVAYLQALALVEQGRYSEARPWLERTEGLLPGRVEVDVARARVELRMGEAEKARRQLKSLAEEEPYAPRAWTGLGEAYWLEGDGRDLKAARRALSRAVDTEPIPAEATLLLGEVWYERRGQNADALPKALELFEKAAEINPHLPRYKERLALFLSEIGYPDRARELFEKLEDARGLTAPSVLESYRLQLAAGAPDDVLEELLELAEKQGAAARTLERERARGLLAKGDKDSVGKARVKLIALVDADRADVESRALLAESELALGDRKTAETTILKGLFGGITPDAHQGRLHFALASIQSRTGRWPKAAPRARRAWREMLDEGRPPSELLEAAELAARAWAREGNEHAAMAIGKELTEKLGYHDQAWVVRARAELAANEPIAARSSARKAVERNPDNPRAQAVLGDALMRFGMKDEAEAAYRKAVELAAGTDAEKTYQDKLKRL